MAVDVAAGALDERVQPLLAEVLAARQHGVEHAVGVEHEHVVGRELDALARASRRPRPRPSIGPCVPTGAHRAVAHEQRRRMAGEQHLRRRPGSSDGSATARGRAEAHRRRAAAASWLSSSSAARGSPVSRPAVRSVTRATALSAAAGAPLPTTSPITTIAPAGASTTS